MTEPLMTGPGFGNAGFGPVPMMGVGWQAISHDPKPPASAVERLPAKALILSVVFQGLSSVRILDRTFCALHKASAPEETIDNSGMGTPDVGSAYPALCGVTGDPPEVGADAEAL